MHSEGSGGGQRGPGKSGVPGVTQPGTAHAGSVFERLALALNSDQCGWKSGIHIAI